MRSGPIITLMLMAMVMMLLVFSRPHYSNNKTERAQKSCAEYKAAVDAYANAVEYAKRAIGDNWTFRSTLAEADRLHIELDEKRRQCQAAIDLLKTQGARENE